MRIAVFGLGYVGVVTSACLAKLGHTVVGVDPVPAKVDAIREGRSPIIEEKIDDLISEVVALGSLRSTIDARDALTDCDLALICVGTPSNAEGGIELRYLEAVTREISALIDITAPGFTLVYRSTMLPGTTRQVLTPALTEGLGGTEHGINVVFHPEFLREGSSVDDFYDPPKIVVGESEPGSGDRLLSVYDGFEAPIFVTSLEVAECVKYADNAYHALKITFANEIATICHKAGADSRSVMEVFCADTKLNISSRYLRPGFAFGGSCLPKDLRALMTAYPGVQSDVPMLSSILDSNNRQIDSVVHRALSMVESRSQSIGMVGLAFKPGTDDLRESPLVALCEAFLGKGYKVKVFDAYVEQSRFIGQNKAFVNEHLPHIAGLLVRELSELEECHLVIVGHPLRDADLKRLISGGKQVLDLVGLQEVPEGQYTGLFW